VIRRKALALALLLALAAPGAAGCATATASTPPDWAYFDVVVHPGGGIPSTLGYYAGTAIWSPFGWVLGGLLPYPADEAVARKPGEGLGTVLGLVLGAPFHLIALPFGAAGPPEDAAPEAGAQGTGHRARGPARDGSVPEKIETGSEGGKGL
jgi:hypothetical protein